MRVDASSDDEEDVFGFRAEMRSRGLASGERGGRTPKRRKSSDGPGGGSAVKKGSVEWLLREREDLERATARDDATLERRRADDAALERRRKEEEEAVRKQAEREDANVMRAMDEEDEVLAALGEGFKLREIVETLGDVAFTDRRVGVRASDARMTTCASKPLRAIVKRAKELAPSVSEQEMWRALLLERWLPERWATAPSERCDEATMEWLWDVATSCGCADLSFGARDALLVTLGFEGMWGSVDDGRGPRFDYHRKDASTDVDGQKCEVPPWELYASAVCDVLRTLGVRDYLQIRRASVPAATGQGSKAIATARRRLLRHELFVTLEIVTAFCDNAFARNVEAFANIDGCARILQMYAGIELDSRAIALDVVLRRATSALLASVPKKSWDSFKVKAIRYLLDVVVEESTASGTEFENVGMCLRLVRWLPGMTLREKDLRAALAAAGVACVRHLLPLPASEKPKKITSAEKNKLVTQLARDDESSIMLRRSEASKHLCEVRVNDETPAQEIYIIAATMDLVDVVLRGGVVIEAEESRVDGGLLLFTRFLQRKVARSGRRSLSALRTNLYAMKTRYERLAHVCRENMANAKDSVYEL